MPQVTFNQGHGLSSPPLEEGQRPIIRSTPTLPIRQIDSLAFPPNTSTSPLRASPILPSTPQESAASQSDRTNNPSTNETGLDVSHHTRISPRGGEQFFFFTSSFTG